MTDTTKTLSVAVILIGNELLSGKIADQNGHYAARRLRGLGADLGRIVTIPDELSLIVDEVRLCREQFDVVITSGGVGPTHDDITLEAISEAFGLKTQLNSQLEELIRGYFKDRTTEGHLRMARIPEGSILIDVGEMTWPVVSKENVYILPGVPEIFRAKFEAIAGRLRVGRWFLRSVYLNVDEGTIAEALSNLEGEFDVSIGSYPRWRGVEYRVRVTVESRRSQPVNDAMDKFLSGLDKDDVVRVDPEISVRTRSLGWMAAAGPE